jgi:lipoyl(octanoyl) transferase
MGRVPYEPMLRLQQQRHAAVFAGEVLDTLFLLEHNPVITLGRNSGDGHVLAGADELRAAGVEVHHAGRGGDVTYHAPGQIVGYPVVHLIAGERDVRKYVYNLEEILIRTAADFGVKAARVEGLRGIWVGNNKLAAIGVRLSRWTTMHGFALNVNIDLRGFDLIVPCGIWDRGVTSLQSLLGKRLELPLVCERLAYHSGDVLGRELVEHAASPLPQDVAALGA